MAPKIVDCERPEASVAAEVVLRTQLRTQGRCVRAAARASARSTAWLARELGLPVLLEEDMGAASVMIVVEEPGSGTGRSRKLRADGMAINLYLCRKHGAGFAVAPRGAAEEADALAWSRWATTRLEPALSGSCHDAPGGPGTEHEGVRAALAELERGLSGRPFLIAARFTVADLNLAASLALAAPTPRPELLRDFPKTCGWLDRCMARPHALSFCVQSWAVKDAQGAVATTMPSTFVAKL